MKGNDEISFNMVTLDGFFERANGDINWHNMDGKFDAHLTAEMKRKLRASC
jgi:hypothetical protein